MSFLNYDGIQLSLVQTRRYLQEPIAVGQDGAGFRHVLTVLATVHLRTIGIPGGVAGAGPAPLQNAGLPKADSGLQAYLAVRDRLMRYRRPFQFVVATRVIADLPGPFPADVELGPKPLACNLVQFNADGSLLVEYTIQWAAPNPCKDRNGVMAVLAHAWSSEDDLDEQWFLTRTYQGTVHFDPRVVGAASGKDGINPDQVRQLLLPPRTLGCTRSIQVRLSEDGYTMQYQCVDRQPQAFVNSFEVLKVEASQSVKTVEPGLLDWLGGAGRIAGGIGAAARLQQHPRQQPGPLAGVPGRNRTWGEFAENIGGYVAPVFEIISGAVTAVPVTVHTFEATCFGNPASYYSELARVARVIVLFRLMRGTLMGLAPEAGVINAAGGAILGLVPYGGYCEQVDTAVPKTSTVRMQLVTRADAMTNPKLWDFAGNRMYNPANATGDEIKGADGLPVPNEVRQLMFAGTVHGQPQSWGWLSGSYAGPLVGSDTGKRDSDVPENVQTPAGKYPGKNLAQGFGPSSLLLANSLIQALQDPCAYKEAMAFQPRNGPPLRRLP